jgi:hypothetical protein
MTTPLRAPFARRLRGMQRCAAARSITAARRTRTGEAARE